MVLISASSVRGSPRVCQPPDSQNPGGGHTNSWRDEFLLPGTVQSLVAAKLVTWVGARRNSIAFCRPPFLLSVFLPLRCCVSIGYSTALKKRGGAFPEREPSSEQDLLKLLVCVYGHLTPVLSTTIRNFPGIQPARGKYRAVGEATPCICPQDSVFSRRRFALGRPFPRANWLYSREISFELALGQFSVDKLFV